MRLTICVLSTALAAFAWNGAGHKAVAGLAYDLLTPAARTRVDDLIRRHPDYKMLTEGAPADEKGKARYAFMKAAFWPDMIKGDPRFYDEARRDAVPTPPAPGFPDTKQRRNWHYINVAFSTDGTETPPPPPVNVLSQIRMILPVVGQPPIEPGSGPAEHDPVYLLPWLLHLVGDVHQPLHCATRFRKGQVDPATGRPWSDLGGNTVFVVGANNLHAYWDDSLGITDTRGYVDGLVRSLRKVQREASPLLDPQRWVDEGFDISKAVVYSFGNEGGSKENPIRLTDQYHVQASQIARRRAAIGGQRLAALLNERLR
jgi:hypothetical protein